MSRDNGLRRGTGRPEPLFKGEAARVVPAVYRHGDISPVMEPIPPEQPLHCLVLFMGVGPQPADALLPCQLLTFCDDTPGQPGGAILFSHGAAVEDGIGFV